MCPANFEYGSLSTITTSDAIISKIQRLQYKFIGLALRLPKHISVSYYMTRLAFHAVKAKLLSCATRTLGRISKNHNIHAWYRFPKPLSVIHPVSLQTDMTYRANFSKHPVAPETGSPAHTGARLAQFSDLELKLTQATLLVCLSVGKPYAAGYLIYLVILSNSQPRNQFLHIEKIKIIFKISKQYICEPTPSTRFLEPTTTRILESTATRLLESATARFLESTTTRSLEPTKWPTTKSAEHRTALQKRRLTRRQSAKCGTKTSADSYTIG